MLHDRVVWQPETLKGRPSSIVFIMINACFSVEEQQILSHIYCLSYIRFDLRYNVCHVELLCCIENAEKVVCIFDEGVRKWIAVTEKGVNDPSGFIHVNER